MSNLIVLYKISQAALCILKSPNLGVRVCQGFRPAFHSLALQLGQRLCRCSRLLP